MERHSLLWLLLLILLTGFFFPACGNDDDDDNDSGGDDDNGTDDDDDNNDDNNDDDNNDDDDNDDDNDDSAAGGDFTATVTANPICGISCIVTWTTSEAASSWVEFGPADGDYALLIGTDDLTTDHRVVVVGMHASTDYKLLAVSETASKTRLESQELSFSAASLPYVWLAGDLDVYEEGRTNDGWTLTNLSVQTMEGQLAVAMYDMEGEPVWYYVPANFGARIDLVASWVDDQYVLVGPSVQSGKRPFEIDLEGNKVWEGPVETGSGMTDDGAMHHVLHKLTNGDYITTYNDVRSNVAGDDIVEFDADLTTTWSWSFWDHLTPKAQAIGRDWTHVNTVLVDFADDIVYVNSFALSQFFKIDRTSGEILWTFGEGGDFTADPDATYPWYGGGHGIDALGDNQFLFYDNGLVGRNFSRAIIYQLDENTMESSIIWEYKGAGSDAWYNMSLGDADRLDNGNILIVAGNGTQNQSGSRFIEVTPDGEKVWQMWLYSNNQTKVSSYQADRIPALAEALDR
ncbi:MAG: hypothetical protein GX444_05795 [Myxococcales bacterium]|nr:hypothetical protein [Myxococcales bacterium]